MSDSTRERGTGKKTPQAAVSEERVAVFRSHVQGHRLRGPEAGAAAT